MAKCKLKIKQNTEKHSFILTVDYKDFERRLNDLYKTNMFFSTYWFKEHLHGFIKLNEGLYVRLSIVHRLGSIVKIDNTIQNKDLLKMKACTKKRHFVVSIFESEFNRMKVDFYETKFQINVLNDFYIDIAIASNCEIIEQKWHEGATANREAFHKDFGESHDSRFTWSQNTDGNRNQREFFAGSGSNIGGKYGKQKLRPQAEKNRKTKVKV
ncbi:hypothetical protein [Sporosarcina sp. Marseille-Q4943]|uniref:hypothetical protein n=1 Tax=Sporosarcina sp. Marseille-Q4943 TaxID=2942204 RepID=UPI00208DC923|nr:hypothetical protein [Sporosarcina sp. Marseille-Q4943]